MFKEEILENERRRKIYTVILKNPGLHIRELQRIVGIPLSSLQYHLNYLSRRNIILEEKSEHYTRYYCKPLDPEDKRILVILRQKRIRDIVLIMLVNKKAKYRFIFESLGLPASTVSFYLKCLLENNIIERTKVGYENIYTLKDEERIARILVAYQPTFLDKMVDRWASTWVESHYKQSKLREKEQE
ncbi:MAG: winged helix-turn-helix transcriptional regulator [Candidatus Bathyarchaeia archaeon]|jgi:predicted transcriptional regulator